MSDSVRPHRQHPPGSPVPGILQARTLEWVAISFSNAWKWNVKVKSLSRVRPLATPWTVAHQAPPPMGFSRQEHWSGLCDGQRWVYFKWEAGVWEVMEGSKNSTNIRVTCIAYWENTKWNDLALVSVHVGEQWEESTKKVCLWIQQRDQEAWTFYYRTCGTFRFLPPV